LIELFKVFNWGDIDSKGNLKKVKTIKYLTTGSKEENFLVLSDTHLGHEKERLDLLDEMILNNQRNVHKNVCRYKTNK